MVGHFRPVSQCVWFSHKVAIKIVGVGATTGPSVGATFGPFVGPTLLGSQNCWSYISPFSWATCWGQLQKVNATLLRAQPKVPTTAKTLGPTKEPKVTPSFWGAANCWPYKLAKRPYNKRASSISNIKGL